MSQVADYNPQTPTIRGQEWQPRSARTIRLDSPLKGIAQRFKAGATTAMANLHPYFSLIGDKPGLALEIIDDPFLVPKLTQTVYFPGTETGAVTTGWEDEAGGTEGFADINDFAVDAYIRNTSALAATATLDMKYRGSTTALDLTTRIVNVALLVSCRLSTSTSNAKQVSLRGLLDIGGTVYPSDDTIVVPRNGKWAKYTVAEWPVSPVTDIPWVSTSLDDLWSSSDEFGIRLQGKTAAAGFHVAGMGLNVTTCPENRKAFYYVAGSLGLNSAAGWVETVLASASTLVNGAYYWVHMYGLTASAQDYLATAVHQDPDLVASTTPTETGEHRYAVSTQLVAPSGAISVTTRQPGEMVPLLLDNGAVTSQSQSYAELDTVEAAEKIGGVYLDGTGDYVTAPDSTGLSITGDMELQVLCALDDWTPSAAQTLIGKWLTTGNQESYRLDVSTGGNLVWTHTANGSTDLSATSTAALASTAGISDGQAIWAAARIDVNNGAAGWDVFFYYSFDGITWTQLGTTVTTATATSIHDGTALLELGAHSSGASLNAAGTFYRARVISGLTRVDIRAEPVLYADETFPVTVSARLTDTTIADTYNNTYTFNGNAAFQRFGVGQQITDAASTAYVGVRLPLAWYGALPPDAALTVEVRSGTAAAEGRGTLQATAYVFPDDVPASGARVDALFAGGAWTSAGTTQYVVRLSSPAARGRGWKVFRGDTRSDQIISGTTLAEIEGASQGGQTDSYISETAVVQDRYDIGCALIAAVSGAASLAASIETAA